MGEKRVSVREFRSGLTDALNDALQGNRTVVERHGAPIAVLIPLGEYTQMKYRETTMAAQRLVLNNISGGEGKSFLSFQLAFALADLGYRVAAIDTDPQASLTKRFGLHEEKNSPGLKAENTILSIFESDDDTPQLVEPIQVAGIDIWPANRGLLAADSAIAQDLGKIGNLNLALKAFNDRYDFIIIDTRPAVSPLLSAAIAAAEHIIVPISADKGMENLDELARLTRIAKMHNPKAGVRLFVPNKVVQTRLGKAILSRISEYSRIAPIGPGVRLSTTGGESELERLGVTRFAPKSPLAGDIRSLTEAIIELTSEKVGT